MSKETVLIDIRDSNYLQYGGKAVYNLRLTQELIKNKNFNWILITDQKTENFQESENVKIELIQAKGLLWHFKLRKYILKNSPDYFLAMTSYLTPFLIKNTSVKSYVFIHDLICFLFPEGHSFKAKFMETFFLPRIIDHITGIFTVSHSTKKDLLLLFPHINQDKISQAPCGFSKPEIQDDLKPIHHRSYMLSVSTIIPRKNFETLIQAFTTIQDSYDGDLVIIGNPTNISYYADLKRLVKESNLTNRVFFKGFVSQENLKSYYSFTDVFIYPSKYEGFGIPLLEAMGYKAPVIASNSSSLPEVGQDAVLYFDPDNSEQLADIILNINQNPEIKTQLNLKAQSRLNTYSWEKTAEQVLNFIQKA